MPSLFGTIGLGKKHRAIRLGAASSTTPVSKTGKFAAYFADPDAGFFFTPIAAMVLNAGLTAVYILTGSFDSLVTFYGVAGYTFYFLTVLGLIVLRVREPDLERPYKCWIATPIIFCCVSLFLLSRAIFAKPLQALVVVAFIAVGVPLYWWRVGSKRERSGRREGGDGVGWKFWKRWGRG